MIRPDDICHAVLFVSGHDKIRSIIEAMISHAVSCVLVLDDKDVVSGIITERDIVRKFTLLDKGDKLEATANALMSRPVHFAHIDTLAEDLFDLHFTNRVRHFPVVGALPLIKENILGIMTTTDLSRRYLRESRRPKTKETAPALKVLLLGTKDLSEGKIQRLLTEVGFQVAFSTDAMAAMTMAAHATMPVLIDLDDNFGKNHADVLTAAVKHPTDVVFLTASATVASQLKLSIKESRRLHVMLKPIDISFLNFMFHKTAKSPG